MGASSTFAHAPISKCIILGSAFLSLFLSGHKHLLDLPLHPHLTRDFQIYIFMFFFFFLVDFGQFWRILTHHAACSTSADLLLTVLILWHTSVAVERRFGTVKYASYLIVVVVIGSLFELIGLVISHSVFGYRRAIPSGPFLVTFAIVYQHGRMVPSMYWYRVGGVTLSSHSLVPETLSFLLLLFNPLSSFAGVLVAALYRNHQLGLARWRIRHSLLPRFFRRPSESRRKPRPTHASLEDDPRFDATIAASRDP
ncbi:hypothetical protein VP01_84g1 [Puccinia sorghi]|uniref:Uncharacterized protein n=1 Tax=Puccinia sorghi TaxID=27349 RepID=A0A0L6U991_9BASI|nr:hypothetical protein VP01_84g1 [Puccinia sorghi]